MKKENHDMVKSKTRDRHKSGFMVRLPEEWREWLQEVTAKSRRTMTSEVQIALSEYRDKLKRRKKIKKHIP